MFSNLVNWWYSIPPNHDQPENKLQLGERHAMFISEIQKGVQLKPVEPLRLKNKLMREILIGVPLRHVDKKRRRV